MVETNHRPAGVPFPATVERDYPVIASHLKSSELSLLNNLGNAMTLIKGKATSLSNLFLVSISSLSPLLLLLALVSSTDDLGLRCMDIAA